MCMTCKLRSTTKIIDICITFNPAMVNFISTKENREKKEGGIIQ